MRLHRRRRLVIRQVQQGEFAEQPLRGGVVHLRRGQQVVEEAQLDQPAVQPNAHVPLVVQVRHALEAGAVVGVTAAVAHVLLAGDKSQVCPRVVEPVVVDVIHELAGLGVQDDAVHVEVDRVPVGVDGADGIAVGVEAPFPLDEPTVIGVIHQRERASREGNSTRHE